MTTAYLIVSHGSRDPRPQIGMERLAYLIQQRLAQKTEKDLRRGQVEIRSESWYLTQSRQGEPIMTLCCPQIPKVATAYLELAPIPLHQSIIDFAWQISRAGCHRLVIIPLFLSPGVHVREDIPQQVEIAKKSLGTSINLELSPYLGSNPKISIFLEQEFMRFPAQESILIAHGSRQGSAKRVIENLARKLGVLPAYWLGGITLQEQVALLAQSGVTKIAILPYFLFPGRITDAIATQIQEIQEREPDLELYLGNPLGARRELADLIIQTLNR